MWTPITEESIVTELKMQAGKKERLHAYERVREATKAMNHRSTQVRVPEGTTFELKMHEFEEGTSVIEVFVERGATLTVSSIMDDTAPKNGLYILKVHLADDANYDSMCAFLGENSPVFIHETYLNGAHAKTTQKNIFFGNREQHLDIFSSTTLIGPHTRADITARGVLNDNAHIRFDGAVNISQTAKDSEGHLHEHTILLSPTSKIQAVPGLNIATNDVRASHAASVTRIDDEHLFYLNSRGIEDRTASKMIIEGFLGKESEGRADEKTINELIGKKIDQL